MARKNKYKINDVPSYDDDEFLDDNIIFDDREEFLEDHEKGRPVIKDYPADIDEDDLDYDFKAERRRNRKTRKERFGYKGKYELLPERENQKQIRFYERRFRYRTTALITGILALPFAFVAFKYNLLFSLLVILMVIPGFLWGLVGLIKIRTAGIITIIIGLTLNVIAVIMISKPLFNLIPHLKVIVDLIKTYFDSYITSLV